MQYESCDMEVVRRQTQAWAEALAARINQQNRDAFALVEKGWREVALRNQRDLKQPVPPKPLPPLVAHVVFDERGWPAPVVYGPEYLCPPIADLEPIPPAAEGIVVRIGPYQRGDWYSALEGDTAPDGYEHKEGGSTFRKRALPFGPGLWLKVV